MDGSDRWVTLAFTWTGLQALGVPEESLATVPDEFREGMLFRAGILGDTGGPRTLGRRPRRRRSARDHDLVPAQCRRSIQERDKLLARTDGVPNLSYLDLNATPPFNYAHDHFGFRDRLSQPVMKGSGEEPTPGSGAALAPGEFILGHPHEDRPVKCCRATAVTWHTAGRKNMSWFFVIISARIRAHSAHARRLNPRDTAHYMPRRPSASSTSPVPRTPRPNPWRRAPAMSSTVSRWITAWATPTRTSSVMCRVST
jgi:hypothetical protein